LLNIKEANLNQFNTPNDNSGNLLIQDTKQKLDLLGVHFASINDQNSNLGSDRLSTIVIREASVIKKAAYVDMINHDTVTQFHDKNTADSPVKSIDIPFFTNTFALTKKFKKLNNKRSVGHDQIPNIVLKKHIPQKIRYYLTILFNNMLNNMYFPQKWKELKLLQY